MGHKINQNKSKRNEVIENMFLTTIKLNWKLLIKRYVENLSRGQKLNNKFPHNSGIKNKV